MICSNQSHERLSPNRINTMCQTPGTHSLLSGTILNNILLTDHYIYDLGYNFRNQTIDYVQYRHNMGQNTHYTSTQYTSHPRHSLRFGLPIKPHLWRFDMPTQQKNKQNICKTRHKSPRHVTPHRIQSSSPSLGVLSPPDHPKYEQPNLGSVNLWLTPPVLARKKIITL